MQISVLLDRSRPESLTTQMVDQIREAIRCARIGPGTRLPSSRRLSEQLAISRNTVVRAYDLLLMEGIVESRPASGIYVADALPRDAAPVQPVSEFRDAVSTRMPMPLRHARAPGVSHPVRNRLLYDFFPGRPSPDLFPLKTWRRLLQNNLSHGGGAGLTQYGEPAGLAGLRTAIANHLAVARGIVADPSRIVIVSGVQEGLNLAARLYLARGALSVVEDPCYQGAALAFEAAGAEVASVAVDRDGLIPDDLPRRTASLLYTTPSHQYPTGATLSAERRSEVIDWARRYGCYVIEDDYDCDIRYQGSHLAAAGRARARLHDLHRHLLEISRRRIASRIHGRARAYRGRGLHREIPAQQRQSLAGAGDARRLHAQWQLCGTPASGPLALQG